VKAFINGIQFEGSPQEFAELIASQQNLAVSSVAQSATKIDAPKVDEVQKDESVKDEYFPGTDEFLTALFRYRPSNTSMGREAYIVQVLATNKQYTVKQLVRIGRTDLHTVRQAIKRAVDAGCVINATNIDKNAASVIDSLKQTSKIHMIALGTIEQAKEARKIHEKKNTNNPKVESKTTKLDTGSAPITKIKYTEGA